MNKLQLILRLKNEGKSKRFISRSLCSSRNSIDKYLEIFDAHPLSFAELYQLPEADLLDIVKTYPEKSKKLEVLFDSFAGAILELKKVGVTKQFLWKAYKLRFPDGVGYSQYCQHLKEHVKREQFSYVFEHKAGDKLMVDYAGKKLFLTDPATGELIPVEFFVGVLPCSGYTFAMASMTQKSGDFLNSMQQCLSYFGGVPQAIVTDNLKPAVNKSSKFDPEINASFADFARHYNTVVLPTRAYKPKDKAMVEGAVKHLYNRVYAPLHHKIFHSLSDLNKAIFELVADHNQLAFQKKSGSRVEQFNAIEKEKLMPLPAENFELSHYQQAKVHPNCHVLLSVDKHHYSVPFQYMGSKITIRYTLNRVEIYANFKQVAIHERLIAKHQYTTNVNHLPPSHRYYRTWSADYFKAEGQKIGLNTHLLMVQILTQRPHPEQAYKLCQGVLGLGKKYGTNRLEEVAEICLRHELISYSKLDYLFKIDLKSIMDIPEKQSEINHPNLRGAAYYQ